MDAEFHGGCYLSPCEKCQVKNLIYIETARLRAQLADAVSTLEWYADWQGYDPAIAKPARECLERLKR